VSCEPRHARLLQAVRYVQREGQVIHALVKRLFYLSELLRKKMELRYKG
jgi:hypothetical protein